MNSPIDSKPTTVSLADEEGVKRILIDSLFGLWATVNNLSRLQPSKRERYRVTIFGSARPDSNHWVYEEVKSLTRELARMGCDIVTGGGPGLMQAANEGAQEADALGQLDNIGIRVHLPFEQSVNPFVEQAFEHETFFTRLHHFVLVSDAFIVAPGGIGTVLETMMVWQLLQVRHLHDIPLILIGKMWQELVDWASKHMLRTDCELANAEDMKIPVCVATAEEALAIVRTCQASWRQAQSQASGTASVIPAAGGPAN